MQHLLLLLQEHLQPLLPRRQHPRLRRRQPHPRLLVKVSFLSFFLDSSFSFPFHFSFWVSCCLCVVSGCLRACVFVILLCVSVRFWSSHPRCYAFRLGVKKKRVLLARAKSPDSANPNKRSVGTQNDIINHTTRTFAITIWISPPFRQYILFLSLRISQASRPLRRAETRQESESYSHFRTR